MGESTGDKGAMQRKSSTNLHISPMSLSLNNRLMPRSGRRDSMKLAPNQLPGKEQLLENYKVNNYWILHVDGEVRVSTSRAREILLNTQSIQ